MSLGGVRDEAEIAVTGVTSGRCRAGSYRGMRTAGTVNPVFLLDEIDKMTSDFGEDQLRMLEMRPSRTTRSQTLLEIHDLSQVMFITTANSLSGIPRPA